MIFKREERILTHRQLYYIILNGLLESSEVRKKLKGHPCLQNLQWIQGSFFVQSKGR